MVDDCDPGWAHGRIRCARPGRHHPPRHRPGTGSRPRASRGARAVCPLMWLDVADPALKGDLESGLRAVEELMRDSVKSEYAFVTEAARHLVDAGGKRFRPLLVLLSAQFGDPG